MRTGIYRKQLGFTAIELMVVLIVAVGALTWGGDAYNTYIDNLENQSAAQHASKVRDAAQKYIKDNNASIQAVATATAPASITIAMLQSTGNLDPSFGATNSFGQSYSIKVLQPTAGKLQALILTAGGSAIPELSIRRIAQLIGAQGGYVSSANTAVATGSYSTWSTPLPGNYGVSPGAGHLAVALFFADSGTVSDYLYRNAVSGRADLNTMNTPIIMSSVQTSGNACTDTGAIARDTNGAVLSCQGGTWKSQGSAYWQDSVANYAGLPACTASIAWSTRVAQVPTVGTGPRAYTCDGFVWQPLGVDNSGNLLIPGALTVSGGATFNGAMTLGNAAADAITINGTATANNGLTIGNGTAATASNTLVVNRTATEGGACSPNGAVARDAVGLLLSCQSSVWRGLGGSGFNGLYTVAFNGSCQAINPLTGACSCPAGSVARRAGTFYLNGFWSSQPDNLYACY